MTPRSVCVVSGSRADYGLLLPVMRALQADPAFRLQVAVTGMHLAPEYGLTYKIVEADGFAIDARVDVLVSSDTAAGNSKSVGLGVIGFADASSGCSRTGCCCWATASRFSPPPRPPCWRVCPSPISPGAM
ncbi:UDP-N-acetylglucosamine 2-epimerase [Methylogaea oryzae]|uniref:UDP-N-acetylglucosamine 2-epimerase n=1 Tax=Methylogaea oryzae TaxID=1295382 RepID=UPI0020D03F66|nr:UDP-N-acetylglucosamine 2-epimerase [Methylogaea oryzae]